MDRVYASLERIKMLWVKLERAKPDTPDYDALIKQIRDEVEAHKALIDAEKNPRRKRR